MGGSERYLRGLGSRVNTGGEGEGKVELTPRFLLEQLGASGNTWGNAGGKWMCLLVCMLGLRSLRDVHRDLRLGTLVIAGKLRQSFG